MGTCVTGREFCLLPGGDMPDVPGVVLNGAVGGKDARPGDVDEGHPVPGGPVGVGADGTPVGIAVAVEVGQEHIFVGHASAGPKEQAVGQVAVDYMVGETGGNLVDNPLQL